MIFHIRQLPERGFSASLSLMVWSNRVFIRSFNSFVFYFSLPLSLNLCEERGKTRKRHFDDIKLKLCNAHIQRSSSFLIIFHNFLLGFILMIPFRLIPALWAPFSFRKMFFFPFLPNFWFPQTGRNAVSTVFSADEPEQYNPHIEPSTSSGVILSRGAHFLHSDCWRRARILRQQ